MRPCNVAAVILEQSGNFKRQKYASNIAECAQVLHIGLDLAGTVDGTEQCFQLSRQCGLLFIGCLLVFEGS